MKKLLIALLVISVIVNMFAISFTYDMITFADISIADPLNFSKMTIWILDLFY